MESINKAFFLNGKGKYLVKFLPIDGSMFMKLFL